MLKAVKVISMDMFNSMILTAHLAEFYAGKTAGGNYNDHTGNAYFVSFDKDGCLIRELKTMMMKIFARYLLR